MSEETTPPDHATNKGRIRLAWRKARRWGRRALALSARIFTTLLAIWIVWLLAYETLRRHSLELQTIGVPKRLAEDGFSADVATRRLRDEIKAIEDGAATTMSKTDVEVDQETSDITIPEAGISVAGVAASIRQWLPESWRHEVSGELTQSDAKLFLRLRLNGKVVFPEKDDAADASAKLTDLNEVDILIKNGALRVVEKVQPSIVAIYYYYKKDFSRSEALADRIIDSLPNGDENVARAYNLKGMIAEQRGNDEEAKDLFKQVKNLAVARNNLGLVRYKQGDVSEAYHEFREAIRLDNTIAGAHYNIGVLWAETRDRVGSGDEFPEAFWLDPEFGLASVEVGDVWSDHGTLDDIIAELRLAIWLNPGYARPHALLGTIFRIQGKSDDAAAEFREAIRLEIEDAQLETQDPQLYVALAQILRSQGKLPEAIAEFREAIQLDPKQEADTYYSLGQTIKDLADSSKAEPEHSSELREACKVFMKGATLVSNKQEFQAQMSEMDTLLGNKIHCPPK